jgi:hypothetical protein
MNIEPLKIRVTRPFERPGKIYTTKQCHNEQVRERWWALVNAVMNLLLS